MTCDETPLAWPPSVNVDDLRNCTTCGIYVTAPQAGSLQILTRRQGGGVGDGVNIEESNSIGADYRGQRYTYVESVFHTPGLHVFPGQKDVYPAEYHIHFQTLADPKRALTVVIPVSHRAGDNPLAAGSTYFAAAAAQPDPNATRPTLTTLLPPGSGVIQYAGPDLRGRTADSPTTDDCENPAERQFLLVWRVVGIRASDLERIPREGSLSTDPRDLPAPGIKPIVKQLSRDRLLAAAMFATPGILSSDPASSSSYGGVVATATGPTELACKPVKVVNGRDVVDASGQWLDVTKLLSGGASGGLLGGEMGQSQSPSGSPTSRFSDPRTYLYLFGVFIGIAIADATAGLLWALAFERTDAYGRKNPIKYVFYIFLALGIVSGSDTIDQIITGFTQQGAGFYTQVWTCIFPPA